MKTRDEITAKIMSGIPFTYMALCIWANGSTADVGRTVDRAIQKLRRDGKISYRRERGNRSPIWQRIEKP